MNSEVVGDAEETGPGISGCTRSGPLSAKQTTDDAEGGQYHGRLRTKLHAESLLDDSMLGLLVGRIHHTIWNGIFVVLVMACLPESIEGALVISPITWNLPVWQCSLD